MTILEQYIDCMQKGDETALADLFNEYGVLHDSSVYKAGMDTIHLEGKMAVEMMFHHKFGFNGGPFPIHSGGSTLCPRSFTLLLSLPSLPLPPGTSPGRRFPVSQRE